MNGELLCKVVQRVEGVARKTFLILTVAALHFAVVPRGVGASELVPNTELGSCLFKKGRQVTPAVGKPVGELKPIVRVDTRVGLPERSSKS